METQGGQRMHKPNSTTACMVWLSGWLLLIASAWANDPVIVSGTVLDDASGDPVEGALVNINANGFENYSGTTQGDGTYSIDVPVGGPSEILIEAASAAHQPQRFGGTAETPCYFGCGGGGGHISVAPGDTVANADFNLIAGGSIEGTVIQADGGAGIPGVELRLFSANGSRLSSDFWATTDGAGVHTSPLALPPGDFFVLAQPVGSNFVAQAWQGINCQWGACPITETGAISVSEGANSNGVDFALDAGAVVSGTLNPTDVFRIVSIWNGAGIFLTANFLSSTDGAEWSFDGLNGGSYYIDYGPSGVTNFLRKLHNGDNCGFNACDRARGEPLNVSSGSVINGLDFELAAGGNITGTVVDASDGSAPDYVTDGSTVGVFRVLTLDQTPIGGGFIRDVDGSLEFATNRALPPGDYYVQTYMDFTDKGIGYGHGLYSKPVLPGYSDAMYGAGACVGMECDVAAATPVTVTENDDTDIVLELETGGNISGTVVNNEDDPVAEVTVKLVDETNKLLAATATDTDGGFDFGGFPDGQYYVRTSVAGDTGNSPFRLTQPNPYFDRVYGDAEPCSEELCDPSRGTAIALSGGASVSGIDMNVDPGPVIRGRIVDATTGLTIARGRVAVFNDSNELVGRYKISDVTGRYQTTALEPGTYSLVPEVSPAFEVVTDSSSIEQAAAVSSLSRTTGIRSGQESVLVNMGTEDVDANLPMVETFIDRLFRSRFTEQP